MHERRGYSPYGYKKVGDSWEPLPGELYGIIERPSTEISGLGYPLIDHRPECARCNIAGHGYICHFSDGSCLRTIQEGGGPDYGVGDICADGYGQTG